jgi:hypothetical protein
MMSALGKESESGDEAEEGGGGDGGEEKAARRELLAERWRLRKDIAAGDLGRAVERVGQIEGNGSDEDPGITKPDLRFRRQ